MPAANEHPPRAGLHWAEWGCEAAGTALLLLGGVSAVCLDFGSGSPVARAIPSVGARLLLTGLLFAGTGALVTVSPLGRRSGAHLNPAVTLAFRLTGHVHDHDLAGYVAAQFAGAFAGTALAAALWSATARSVHDAATLPGHGVGAVEAVAAEAVMTAMLVLTIFLFVSHRRTMRWTPLAVTALIAVLVWAGGRVTGTSLNPARSLAPAVLAGRLDVYWIDVVGPLLGTLLAVLLYAAVPRWRILTAKLFHDPRYPSTLGGSMPVARR